MAKQIIVFKEDFEILQGLVQTFKPVDPQVIKCIEQLKIKLHNAKVLQLKEMPTNIVRLNSIITVNTSFGRKVGLELVLPKEADFQKRKLSIITPLGASLMGVEEGEKSLWHFPNGDEWVTIEKVNNSFLKIADSITKV